MHSGKMSGCQITWQASKLIVLCQHELNKKIPGARIRHFCGLEGKPWAGPKSLFCCEKRSKSFLGLPQKSKLGIPGLAWKENCV